MMILERYINLFFNKLGLLMILLLILLPKPAHSADILTLNNNIGEYPLGRYVSILQDTDKTLTIKDVIKSKGFIKSIDDSPNPGLTSSAIWLRFIIKNASNIEAWNLELRIATLDTVEFYKPDQFENFIVERTGFKQPNDKRMIPHRFFIFRFSIPKGQTKTFYLRTHSQDAITLPMSIISEQVLDKKDYIRQYILGIYYGILTVMILYNLFIYLFLRDESYLYYVLYFGSFLMVQSYTDGILYGYLWTELTGLGVSGECFFIGLTLFFGTLFSRSFLQTSIYSPMFDKLIVIIVIVSGIYSSLTPFMPPDIMLKIIIMLGLISIPIVLAAGAVCLYRGYKPARFYLMANILFLLGIVINLFADLSLIPMNFIAEHGMRIGSGVDVTLTSIALADRINILRGELELAEIKTKALNLQLDQYNKTLEQRVLERTTQLKESRDRLVQAEKMASLGELVSGVAHEINTPIGIGVTAASTLTKSTQSLETSLKNNTMTKTDFERYLDTARQSSELILKHLLRAGELVKSFKMVSADQTSSEKRQFLIGAYIEDVITSLRPEIKKTSLNIKINYVKDIEISSYPGAIAQIITNLLMNSIIHGYEKGSQGNIIIDISQTVDRVLIDFKDDGKGIEGDILPKIFNPFFTTRRGFGGTGLGLNIVFNLINQTLKGAITCQSELKAGTVFHISLPIEV